MSLLVPSYLRKLSWAEKHIQKLEDPIAQFRDRHPYRTRKLTEGQNKGKWIFEFTEQADPAWSLMLGDALYNLRATLDYLACDLNPSARRPSVMFPIVTRPVWEIDAVDGEDSDLADARRKWDTATKKMRPEAVEIIKRLQPIGNHWEPFFHPWDLLNRLSNKDRHRGLIVYTSGLINPTTCFVMRDGITYTADSAIPTPGGQPGVAALQHQAILTPPPELDHHAIVDVQLKGTATQAVQGGDQGRQVIIPDTLHRFLGWIRDEAVSELSPYLHVS